jgi:hexosaminidase
MRTTTYEFTTQPLIGTPVDLITPPHGKYNHHGNLALTDGIRGQRPWKGSQWLGFEEDTVQFAIDLGKNTKFGTLELGTLHDPGSWIYHPKTIRIETSPDGKTYRLWKEQAITDENIVVEAKGKARFVRVTLINDAVIPEGNPGAGFTPWTFIDELIIRN